jgi:hypothetical protein
MQTQENIKASVVLVLERVGLIMHVLPLAGSGKSIRPEQLIRTRDANSTQNA